MILVTGASGFVGRHLVAALRRRGDAVRTVQRGGGDEDTVVHDLAAGPLPPDAWRRVTAVVHAAAHVPADLRDPSEARRCLEVNALPALALAEACRERGLPLVHLSSGNVYTPRATPADEDAPTWPARRATPYLASKLCGELYVGSAIARGLRAVILRPSSIYGPGMRGGVLSTFVRRLRAGERVSATVGPYRADFVWVGDVVAAALAALDRAEVTGPVNVGSGRAVGMDALARAVADGLGCPERVDVTPQADADPGFAPLALERAVRALGHRPTPLEAGLRALLEAP